MSVCLSVNNEIREFEKNSQEKSSSYDFIKTIKRVDTLDIHKCDSGRVFYLNNIINHNCKYVILRDYIKYN